MCGGVDGVRGEASGVLYADVGGDIRIVGGVCGCWGDDFVVEGWGFVGVWVWWGGV